MKWQKKFFVGFDFGISTVLCERFYPKLLDELSGHIDYRQVMRGLLNAEFDVSGSVNWAQVASDMEYLAANLQRLERLWPQYNSSQLSDVASKLDQATKDLREANRKKDENAIAETMRKFFEELLPELNDRIDVADPLNRFGEALQLIVKSANERISVIRNGKKSKFFTSI